MNASEGLQLTEEQAHRAFADEPHEKSFSVKEFAEQVVGSISYDDATLVRKAGFLPALNVAPRGSRSSDWRVREAAPEYYLDEKFRPKLETAAPRVRRIVREIYRAFEYLAFDAGYARPLRLRKDLTPFNNPLHLQRRPRAFTGGLNLMKAEAYTRLRGILGTRSKLLCREAQVDLRPGRLLVDVGPLSNPSEYAATAQELRKSAERLAREFQSIADRLGAAERDFRESLRG